MAISSIPGEKEPLYFIHACIYTRVITFPPGGGARSDFTVEGCSRCSLQLYAGHIETQSACKVHPSAQIYGSAAKSKRV